MIDISGLNDAISLNLMSRNKWRTQEAAEAIQKYKDRTAAPAPAGNNQMSKMFTHTDYADLVEATVANLKRLSALKGGEYAGDDDRLANFRRNAAALGLPMEAVWHTYTAKHWDAVTQYVKDLVQGKSRERLEPLSSRLDDIIVYCILFKAMLQERDNGKVGAG